MGIINKNTTIRSMTTLAVPDTYISDGFAAESTTCPVMGMLFEGLKKGMKDYNELTGATADWSDGASFKLKALLTGATYLGDATSRANADAALGIQAGVGNALTATAAASGAWVVGQTWAAKASDKNAALAGTAVYLPVAKVTATDGINIATTDIADAEWFLIMPYDKKHKAKTEGELDAATGDRLDKGDEVGVIAGTRVDTDAKAASVCGTKVVVVLGATSLAAGSVALAAALAF